MKPLKHLKVLSVLLASLTLLCGCSKSIEQRLEEFYHKNRDNPDIMMLSDVFITPVRSLYMIKLWDYSGIQIRVASFDRSREPQLVLSHGEESLRRLDEEFNLDHDAAMEYLTKLYSVFDELEVLVVHGAPTRMYIEFFIDPSNVVVYVPDRSRLTESARRDITEFEQRAVLTFDEHWFAYRRDKPFDFGG